MQTGGRKHTQERALHDRTPSPWVPACARFPPAEVVAQEFHLPARKLKPTWLDFQPGERAFYDQVGGPVGSLR